MYDTAADDIAVVRTLIDREATGDVSAILDLVAVDVVFDMPFAPGGAGRIEGAAALGEALTVGIGMYQEWTMALTSAETGGRGVVFAEYTAAARTTTGFDYHQHYIGRFILSGGRITGWREWFNPLSLQAAIASLRVGESPSAPTL
ncbi:nuclear transport factor 2 family protein [Rhodococcus spelaei]|uniref:Nuclear transport factor 2 family protein n=1 Tax=Rhodococcus spelaei TaxID=2546320 RepID=A0A541BAB1_9NOCA|nr:nuclear transport factor 2 family protein [Rhodococcus spelaei]TQF69272.1 nuclear transport factor 2 family protein [Rhodococcus spelaei]